MLRNVRLLGNQDTLYVASGRQFFENCYIEGNVDFIFGNGKAVFSNCEIRSTPHSVGYITAQGKKESGEDSLFVFDRCQLTAYPGVAGYGWGGRGVLRERGVPEHRDGRAHRGRRLARVASR